MYRHARTKLRIPFRFLEPTFYAGLLDDPVLLLRNRPEGSNILVDCGQVHHLAKRVLKGVATVFISHAHMDHFMGMASFARNVLVSTRTVDVYGPPGLSQRLECLLSGFDWNLCENFWCSFRVHEIDGTRTRSYLLPGPDGFRRREEDCSERPDDVIHANNQLQVRTAPCDHKIPSLIYRFDEKPGFVVDNEKLLELGLVRGDWLRELNSRYNRGELDRGPITILAGRGQHVEEKESADAGSLYQKIRTDQPPLSIGYLTDAGWNEGNRRVVNDLFAGVSVLICECTYARAEVDKARASFHFCTADLNELMRDLRPGHVLPIHVSKAYSGETERIFDELTPPAGTTLLRLPDHIAPRPYLPDEVPAPEVV